VIFQAASLDAGKSNAGKSNAGKSNAGTKARVCPKSESHPISLLEEEDEHHARNRNT
jgi:hypothetical protein